MSQFTTLHDLFEAILQLHSRKEYAAALALVEREAPNFPDSVAQTTFWRMCFTSLLGRTDEAIALLRGALDAGHWYAEAQLRGDRDLASLQGHPEFEALVKINAARVAEAQAKVKPHIVVIEPGTPPPHPLLVALHGNNSNADLTSAYYQAVAAAGWLVALPQSTQVGGQDRYVWNDRAWAAREVTEHVAALGGQYPLDESRAVISGFSMGGQVACWLALTGALPVQGMIGVATYLPALEELRPHIEASAERGLRACLIIGDADSTCYEGTLALHALLQAWGVPSMLKVYPGLAHLYPPDFDRVLVEALGFVAGAV